MSTQKGFVLTIREVKQLRSLIMKIRNRGATTLGLFKQSDEWIAKLGSRHNLVSVKVEDE